MSLIIKQRENDHGRSELRENGSDANGVGNQHSIHLLPCKIQPTALTADEQTFTAPVDRYFRPYTKAAAAEDNVGPTNGSTGTTLWHASLRGKPLTGVKLDMPKGYVGVMCHSEKSSGEVKVGVSSVDVDLIANDTGDEASRQIMYWNWDRVPSREDPLLAAFDWVHVSEAIMANDD